MTTTTTTIIKTFATVCSGRVKVSALWLGRQCKLHMQRTDCIVRTTSLKGICCTSWIYCWLRLAYAASLGQRQLFEDYQKGIKHLVPLTSTLIALCHEQCWKTNLVLALRIHLGSFLLS